MLVFVKNKCNICGYEEVEEVEEAVLSEVEEILLQTDVNSITPMQALTLLAGLKDKVNKS